MKNNKTLLSAAAFLLVLNLFAQHGEHDHHQSAQPAQQSQDSTAVRKHQSHMHQSHVKDSTAHQGHGNHLNMSHAFSRNLPMNRNGSGTGWLPDASPMYGYMIHTPKWMYMLHGNVFIRYNNQDLTNQGSRGGAQFDVPNWFMGMGQRTVGQRGLFRFSAMLSLDPLTVGGAGYPLLFQSGETWKGKPLVDRQHPHDLFSELSIGYSHSLSKDADVFGYVGYPGEPAFGPVAFMHRPSSLFNPDAPLGHHWQDATHIVFGVATVGFRYKNFKLEGSSFTGQEPNEERYGFDRPRFDSWSARFSYNPSPEWALQVSKAWVKGPHALDPNENVNKTTASVIHAKRLGVNTFLNSAAVWGYNYSAHHHQEHSALLESSLAFRNTAVYGKYEWVQKSTEELMLEEDTYGHGSVFPINAVTLGVNQNLFTLGKTRFSLGVQGTYYGVDKQLQNLYGKNPLALQTFIRVYPGLMSAGTGR